MPEAMRLLLPLLLLSLAACTTQTSAPGAGGGSSSFAPSQFAKTELDRVVEAHQRDLFASLQLLAEKLYRRNPRELKKGPWSRPEEAVQRLFGSRHNWQFPELEGRHGVAAIQLALRPDYAGDRVFALIAGLGGMVLEAFGGHYDSYIFDEVDAQKLYNAARNVEIAIWKLSTAEDANGKLLLVSNETTGPANLSFEREAGKIIGNLDTLSRIIAERTKRTVVTVVQSMATAVFLPIATLK